MLVSSTWPIAVANASLSISSTECLLETAEVRARHPREALVGR